MQFNAQPANLREVQAGDLPVFSNVTSSVEKGLSFPVNLEAMTQVQLASGYEKEGKVEEAIQHYRQALAADPNNVLALNNLAWILATASQHKLRDGEEAVQLATQAVVLTDFLLPILLETLGVRKSDNDAPDSPK